MYKLVLPILIIVAFAKTMRAQKDITITRKNCDVIVSSELNKTSATIRLIFMPDTIVDPKDKDKTVVKAADIVSVRVAGNNYTTFTPDKESIITIVTTQPGSCSACGNEIWVKYKGCEKESFISLNTCPGIKVCNCRTPANWFGEDPADYENGKESIILNFDENVNKRNYYRVYYKTIRHRILKKNRNYEFVAEPINFSKYKVCGNKDLEFKVVNVNRFIYDVKFADSTTSFSSSPSPLFNELFKGDNSGTLGVLLSAFKTNMQASPLFPNATSDVPSPKAFIDTLEKIVSDYNNLQGAILQAYNPSSCFPASMNYKYESYANGLLHFKVMMAVIQAEWQPSADTLAKQLEEQKKCADLDKQKKDLEKKIKDLEEEDELSEAQKASLKELKTKLSKQKVCAEKEKTQRDSLIKRLQEELKPYDALIQLQKELPDEKSLEGMIVFINNMADINQTYSSGPMQVTGNELKISLDIHTNDSAARVFRIPKLALGRRDYVIPVVGKAFGSFSSGLFISPDPRMKNKEYAWQELPNSNNVFSGGDSARYILTESGFSMPPMGIAAYGNIQTMISRNIGLGVSPGVGITMEAKPRVTYLLGASLFAGSERQFVFTAGASAMQVKKLSNNLNYIVDNSIQSTSGTREITYYQEMKFGFFLSLSYTIFTPLTHRN